MTVHLPEHADHLSPLVQGLFNMELGNREAIRTVKSVRDMIQNVLRGLPCHPPSCAARRSSSISETLVM